MEKPLSYIVKRLEDEGGIERFYGHRESQKGHIQLNIEFNEFMDDEVNEILGECGVKFTDSIAIWE